MSTLYLVLGDLYLPLQAAFSSNPTLRTQVVRWKLQELIRDYHPLWLIFPNHYPSVSGGHCVLTLQLCRGFPHTDFQFGLFPVHSPLLRESKFLSFPPLNNMLKFRGSSHSNWDWIIVFILFFPPRTWRREIPIKSLVFFRSTLTPVADNVIIPTPLTHVLIPQTTTPYIVTRSSTNNILSQRIPTASRWME